MTILQSAQPLPYGQASLSHTFSQTSQTHTFLDKGVDFLGQHILEKWHHLQQVVIKHINRPQIHKRNIYVTHSHYPSVCPWPNTVCQQRYCFIPSPCKCWLAAPQCCISGLSLHSHSGHGLSWPKLGLKDPKSRAWNKDVGDASALPPPRMQGIWKVTLIWPTVPTIPYEDWV